MDTIDQNIASLRQENRRIQIELNLVKEKLAKETNKFYELFDRSIAGLFRANVKGEIIDANASFSKILGYSSPEELIEDHIHQPHLKFIIDANPGNLTLPVNGESVENKEIIVLDKAGAINYCLLSWYVVSDYSSDIIEGHLIDITKQKVEEEKAKQYNKQLHNTQSMAKIAFFDYCVDSRQISWSDNFDELFESQLKEPFSLDNFLQFVHPDDYEFVRTSYYSSIENKRKDTEMQFRIITHSKQTKHLNCKFQNYYTFNEYAGTTGWLQDISEIKRSQIQVKENLNMMESILNTIPVSVFWKDVNLKFAGSNHKFLLDAGIQYPKDLIGKSEADMPWSKDVQEILEKDDAYILETGESQLGFEESLISSEQEEFWIKGSKVALRNAVGEIIGVLGVYVDITDSKKSENELFKANLKLAENDTLKTSFLTNISHEIRTPLSAIVGFADMLTKDNIPGNEISHFTRLIQTQADHLLKVVSDVLDISLIESNQIKFEKQTIDLVELLNDQFLILSQQLKNLNNDHIRVKLSTPRGVNKLFIQGDKVRIRQVLNNLIDNAIKFTQFGFIEIGFQKEEDKEVQIFVKDSGVGIDTQSQKIIFERFRQGDHTYKKQFSGLGLGLAIAKELTERMDGQLWFESELEMGSSFYFTIPTIEDFTEPIVSKPIDALDLDEIIWDNKTVLVADDVKHMHQLMNLFLRDKGITLINVMSGEEAIEKVKQLQHVDMIFMDVQMPGMGGIEAMRKIKLLAPDIPLIAFTAYAMEGDKEKYLESGFWNYISKPINQNELLLLMHKYWEVEPSNNR